MEVVKADARAQVDGLRGQAQGHGGGVAAGHGDGDVPELDGGLAEHGEAADGDPQLPGLSDVHLGRAGDGGERGALEVLELRLGGAALGGVARVGGCFEGDRVGLGLEGGEAFEERDLEVLDLAGADLPRGGGDPLLAGLVDAQNDAADLGVGGGVEDAGGAHFGRRIPDRRAADGLAGPRIDHGGVIHADDVDLDEAFGGFFGEISQVFAM